MPKEVILNKGVFVFSLDTELAWGTRGNPKYRREYDGVRDVIRRLLVLCEKYRIGITWAVVGHLFLDSCASENGLKHPEIRRPLGGDDWFSCDPATDTSRDPWWYGPDIVKAIKDCRMPQEIGSHSFSHLVQEPWCTPETLNDELLAAKHAAVPSGLELRSFVFPKNRVKHLHVLQRNGFTAYRGVDRTWYRGLSGPAAKLAHLLDNYLVPIAPTVLPERVAGLWNIPGSYYYVHRRGWASALPVSFRVRKALAGLRAAASRRQVFHLWCHPFNLASDPDGLLNGLEQIFKRVDELRSVGQLEQLTMGQLTQKLNHA